MDVRQRRFVVTEVERAAIPDELTARGIAAATHLVSLASVEDDALGEELQVIWELEPGVEVFKKAVLPAPTAFDAPARLDAFLDAVRWGAVSSADLSALQSPFRSGIDIEDYQLDPVVRALRMPRANLLIADDVGLGKTIEAGLVIQELLLRNRAHTILIVCPSSLQIQWQEQMRDKFGLEFRIVDSTLMKELRRRLGLHENPWTHFPRLITSVDFLKRDRPMRLLREALPPEGQPTYPRRFDLLVVDEAHNVAPSGTGHYATDSLRTQAVRTLVPHFEHKLFLTATPHNGYPESFSALLELLDNQRFARAVPPNREQLATVMVRRLKSEFRDWGGGLLFPKREIEPLEVDYTEEEREIHRTLQRYSQLRQRHASSEAEQYASEFVLKLLKKRLFSSPAAFAGTLEQHAATLHATRQPKASLARPTLGILRRRLDEIQEEFADDEAYETGTQEAVESATRLFHAPTPDEEKLLETLRAYADRAATQKDSKARALLAWLHATLRPQGQWNNERVLIFTEYRTTQKWLQGLLAGEGLAGGDRLLLLYGGMDSKSREQVKAAFQADPAQSPVRILLATDAASEGIDLQNHCHRLIHYEIPWNPNRMEQRNGRLDRHGQRSREVRVYHFVGKGFDRQEPAAGTPPGQLEGDLEFLMRAVIKVDNIREDLGKVGPVIATQVEEAMLGRRQHLDTRQAEKDAEVPKRLLRFERDLREQVGKLHKQLQDSREELHVSPENVQAVVSVALDLAGQPPLREANLPGVWPDPAGRRSRCPVFHLPPLRGSWARCAEGLVHPHTRMIRPITFDHAVAQGRDDVVLVHLNHRLVQVALQLLRAEVWSTQSRKQLHRVAARLVPNSAADTPVAVAFGRLVLLGGDQHRLHEEILTAGGAIREGKLERLKPADIDKVLTAGLPEPAPTGVQERLRAVWPAVEKPLLQALEVQMRTRTGKLRGLLDERSAREIGDMTAILRDLERSIRDELATEFPAQLTLWTDPEREQLERNRESLQARLEQIPREIEREEAAIQARYAGVDPRLFPVAVVFLVPERLARA